MRGLMVYYICLDTKSHIMISLKVNSPPHMSENHYELFVAEFSLLQSDSIQCRQLHNQMIFLLTFNAFGFGSIKQEAPKPTILNKQPAPYQRPPFTSFCASIAAQTQGSFCVFMFWVCSLKFGLILSPVSGSKFWLIQMAGINNIINNDLIFISNSLIISKSTHHLYKQKTPRMWGLMSQKG